MDVLLPGRSSPDKYKLNKENHYSTRTSKVKWHTVTQATNLLFPLLKHVPVIQFPQINDINQNVMVTATGSGEAIVTVSVTDWCFLLDLFLDWNQVLMVSALCWSPLFSNDRWCRCITLYQKKKRATVRSLTYRCNWSQVRSMTVMLSLFFSLSFLFNTKTKWSMIKMPSPVLMRCSWSFSRLQRVVSSVCL